MKNSITITNRFGNKVTITVGETVQFKCDVEQSGIVTRIGGGDERTAKIEIKSHTSDGFQGEYIGGDTESYVFAEECS